MEGRTPDPNEIAGLLSDYSRSPEPGTSALKITINREGNGTGIIVRVHLQPKTVEASERNARELVRLGREILHSSSGVGSPEDYSDRSRWSDLVRAAEKALKSPPTTPFVIKVNFEVTDNGVIK